MNLRAYSLHGGMPDADDRLHSCFAADLRDLCSDLSRTILAWACDGVVTVFAGEVSPLAKREDVSVDVTGYCANECTGPGDGAVVTREAAYFCCSVGVAGACYSSGAADA